MSDIAIVTCQVLPEPDTDEAILLADCRSTGLDVEMAAWDDPDVDWSRYRISVLRSCWNYYEDPAKFRDWLDGIAPSTQLWNPYSAVCENLNKRYLGRLAAIGVPVVPTVYVSPGSSVETELCGTGWERFVIKPTVSAASYMTRLFNRNQVEDAQAFADVILETREVMIQPYMASVERGGEVAIVQIAGRFTHGVLKDPRFTGGCESVSVAFQPDERQLRAAAAVMDTVSDHLLYARVDLMQAESGDWLLSELELTEPSLFLSLHPPALSRFVSALSKL